jgi:glutamyl-tRNA synthetase
LKEQTSFEAAGLEASVKEFMAGRGLKPGEVMPILRLTLAGTMQGPGVFEMMELLGNDRTVDRLKKTFSHFDTLVK